MKSDVLTGVREQTVLIQHILDNQSVKDCYNYFMNNLLNAAVENSSFQQGIYCYGLASLFYKLEMYSEALNYSRKARGYFLQHAKDDPFSMNFMLWEILELGYIYCCLGDYKNAKAMKDDYERLYQGDSPLLNHHYCLLKIRLLQLDDSLRHNFNEVFRLFELKDNVIISRHYMEYLQIFDYIITDGPASLTKQLLDHIRYFIEAGAPKRAVRKYWAAVTEYYKQLGDMRLFEEAFLMYEAATKSREDKYRRARLDTIHNEEQIFNQQDLLNQLENKVNSLKKVSQTDTLTGLANRYLLDEYGNEIFQKAQENKQDLGIIIIDIDHFKHYNDTYGHMVGDQCLTLVGQVMKEVFDRHFIARYGGDEFIAVFINHSADEVIECAEKLKQLLKERTFITVDGEPFAESITVSQGIVCRIPDTGHTWTDFLHSADNALYECKKTSRNSIKFLSESESK